MDHFHNENKTSSVMQSRRLNLFWISKTEKWNFFFPPFDNQDHRHYIWTERHSAYDITELWDTYYQKVGHTAQNIQIALSIYTLPLCPTFAKLFTVLKVQRKTQKISLRSKTVYEIDPMNVSKMRPIYKRALVVQSWEQ